MPLLYLFKYLRRFAGPRRKYIVLYISLFVVAGCIELSEPLIIGRILNIIQAEGISAANMRRVIGLLSLFLVLALAFWLFHGPARVIERVTAFETKIAYKTFLFDGAMRLSLGWHTEHHSGDTIDKVNKGADGLFQFSQSLFDTLYTIIKLVGAYIMLVVFNIHASYILLIMIGLTMRMIAAFDRRLVPQYDELNDQDNSISAKVYDAISNITTVIILRIEKLIGENLVKSLWKPKKLFTTNTKINEMKRCFVSIAAYGITFLVLASYIWIHVAAGSAILVGSLYMLYGYTKQITERFYSMAYLYGNILQWKSSVANAEKLSNAFHTEERQKKQKKLTRTTINISNICFTYPNTINPAIQVSSFILEKGKKIALIGESGGGKTTFMKLLRGLYRWDTGTVAQDEKILPHGLDDICEDIALIPQEPEIFATTIRDNITMGIDYPEKIIRQMTDAVRLTKTIDALPHSFASSVVERGVNLSGGQKQRLALARGILASQNKSIILLDEPTSSVDSKNELAIYEDLFRTYADKTIVSSIHRLHLLGLFDIIYLFDHGTVIATGTFNELLKTSDLFREMWQKYQRTVH